MKLKVMLCSLVTISSLSGCTTMQMLSESKAEYKRGEYVTGTFSGALAIAFGPLIDVFTLGGLLDSQQSAEAWTGIAQQYNAQQTSNAAGQQARLNAQLQAQQLALAQTQINSQNITYGNNSTPSQPATRPKKRADGLNQCISFDRTSNPIVDFLVNKCNQKIAVSWIDIHNSVGLERVVKRSSIAKNTGKIIYAACPDGYTAYLPNAPRAQGYQWKGQGDFECRDW